MANLRDIAEQSGIDYAQAMDRFGDNEALYLRLSAKFSDDPHFDALEQALATEDFFTAQREVHSLKGVAGNLSFLALYETSCSVNDALRADDIQAVNALMPTLREEYRRVRDALEAVNG